MARNRTAWWRVLLALAFSLVGGVTAGVCSLYFAAGSFGEEMLRSYFANPYITVLNLLPPIALSLLLYLLFNRAFWSFIGTHLITVGLTLVHYYKMSFRGDALLAEDLTLVTESGKMLETYELFVDGHMVSYFILFGIGALLSLLLFRGRFRRLLPRMTAAILLCVACGALVPTYTSELYYNEKTANSALINPWSDTQVYVSKGFVYPFLYTVPSAFHPAPEGYDADEAAAVLAQYEEGTIPKEKAVNIVAVMLEAYNDLSRMEELTFVNDVYGKYRELEAMGYSGTLVTDIFAGDTRISERQFLTGLPYSRLDNFISNSNSYVWYLRKNGYTVEGSHPCYAWFYNRENINKKLGFENYFFSENYYKPITGGDITYDARLFPLMREVYETRDRSKPYFSFSITYQGHGPYEDETRYFTEPYVANPGVPAASEAILNNYLNSQKETTDVLYTFAQEMLATEEPLVLVFFGDHKPWMGNNGSVYADYGINMDVSTEQGFLNYYGTRYLILANDAAKAVTGNDFSGEGETISAAFLMNKVFALCGYKGNAYMQYTSALAEQYPVVHRTDAYAETEKQTFDRVSYYYRKNFLYDGYEQSKTSDF